MLMSCQARGSGRRFDSTISGRSEREDQSSLAEGLVTVGIVRVFPFLFTTSEILGRAMLRVVQGRVDQFILESADINRVGA
jgi:hypothetical protein